MKRKLAFLIPAILLIAFFAFKPPAIGSEKGDVVVTPTATFTPSAKPHLSDFDDNGRAPKHSIEEENSDDLHQGKMSHDNMHEDDGDGYDHHNDDESDDESDDD